MSIGVYYTFIGVYGSVDIRGIYGSLGSGVPRGQPGVFERVPLELLTLLMGDSIRSLGSPSNS